MPTPDLVAEICVWKNIMKKTLLYLLVCSIIVVNYSCSSDDVIKAESIKLSESSIEIKKGQQKQLSVIVLPENCEEAFMFNWVVEDHTIATVSQSGLVTALKGGKTKVTASVDGRFSASCDINVISDITSITLNKSEISLKKGDEFTLVATLSPEDATNKDIEWSSDNENIATVTSNGVVKAVGGGKANIVAKNPVTGISASCSVEVIIDVASISLNKTEIKLKKGDEFTLVATINPGDATNKEIEWSSDNEEVVTVSSDGVLKTVANGTATITAKNPSSGISAKCNVAVYGYVESVSLNKTSIEIVKGGSYTLKETVLPNDAINKNVTWSSSDETIATVINGVVKGKKIGKATITVTTEDQTKTASCEVTVKSSEDINYKPYDDPQKW